MVRAKTGIVIRWYAEDEVSQEESEQNEVDGMKKGADSTGAYLKEQLVIWNEDKRMVEQWLTGRWRKVQVSWKQLEIGY